jgi:thioredoxin reductase (NADPH)
MLLLVPVIASSSRHGRVPAFATALASVAAFNFLFVEPYYTFEVTDHRYLITFVMMLAVGATLEPTTLATSSSVAVTPASDDADGPPGAPRWVVHTRHRSGRTHRIATRAVVIATGYFGRPNRLGVPGESLPHVRHGYLEGHEAWREDVVIVGGANSAVDAALDMHRAGGRVTLVHSGATLSPKIKPWVRPDIEARIREGAIQAHFNSRVVSIDPDSVLVAGPEGEHRLPATQVYTMIGYLPETGLLEALGVPVDATTGIPAHDPITMATPVPGVYLAGVIASGLQANRIFIENGRDHGAQIVAHLCATDFPDLSRS